MNPPSLLIAGTTSGVGKTTITLAIMHHLKYRMGYSIQPFKVGPDFIDPSYHRMVTGRESRTLDAWMMGRDGLIKNFTDWTKDADIAVIEGVMGLYDGATGKSDFASSAYVAKLLKSKIILVIDAAKAARSIAAMALGYVKFGKDTKIAGIILNNVSGDKHANYISEAFKSTIKVPILGIIFRSKELKFQERHLGLIPVDELEPSNKVNVIRIAKQVSESINYEVLLKDFKIRYSKENRIKFNRYGQKTKIKIGVALDNSFNFYYSENLDQIRSLGAAIKFFSPLVDDELTEDISGIV